MKKRKNFSKKRRRRQNRTKRKIGGSLMNGATDLYSSAKSASQSIYNSATSAPRSIYTSAKSASQSIYNSATSAPQSMYKAAQRSLYGSTSDTELLDLFEYMCNSLILSIKAKTDLSKPNGYYKIDENFEIFSEDKMFMKKGETFIDSYIRVVVPHIAVRDYDKAYIALEVWSDYVDRFARINNYWYPLIDDKDGETGYLYRSIFDFFKFGSIDILNELKKGSRLSIITDTNEKDQAIATMQEEYKKVGAQKLIKLQDEYNRLEKRKEEIDRDRAAKNSISSYYDHYMLDKLNKP